MSSESQLFKRGCCCWILAITVIIILVIIHLTHGLTLQSDTKDIRADDWRQGQIDRMKTELADMKKLVQHNITTAAQRQHENMLIQTQLQNDLATLQGQLRSMTTTQTREGRPIDKYWDRQKHGFGDLNTEYLPRNENIQSATTNHTKNHKLKCGISNEQTLWEVASRLGPDWRRLGYFLTDTHTVNTLCTPAQGGPELYPLRMLIKWHQGLDSSFADIKDKLATALIKEGHKDLVKIVQEYLGNDERILFDSVSSCLSAGWYPVGLRLGVSTHVLDQIKAVQLLDHDPGFSLLIKWRNQTAEGQKEKLIQALHEVDRDDIVSYLEGQTDG